MGIQPKIALLIISFRIESPIFAKTNKYILTKIPWWSGRYVFGTWKKSGIKELGSELGHLNGILKCNIHSDGQFLTFPTYLGQPQRSLLGSSSKKDCHSITRNTITGQTLAVSAFRICLSFQVKHWLLSWKFLAKYGAWQDIWSWLSLLNTGYLPIGNCCSRAPHWGSWIRFAIQVFVLTAWSCTLILYSNKSSSPNPRQSGFSPVL